MCEGVKALSDQINQMSHQIGPDYIRFSLAHYTYQPLHMLKIIRDINQQYLEIFNLHFVKSE